MFVHGSLIRGKRSKVQTAGGPIPYVDRHEKLLAQAIREKRSMDLDVCIDDQGHPYLGHPKEYHEKTHEPFFDSMPLWEAAEALRACPTP